MIDVPRLPDEVRAARPPVVAAYGSALEAAVQTLSRANAALAARVADLERRLGQNSTNSSRPLSSDPPGRRRAAPKRPPSGRRPGGQPGHPGQCRALLPPEQVTHTVRRVPSHCAGCGAPLPQMADPTDPEDERQQVVEVPTVAAVVIEYQLAARRCAGCGHLIRAALPAAAGASGFGPRLTAICTLLTGRYRLSKRKAAACVGDVFGVRVAVGSVSALEQTMSAAPAPVVAEARTVVQQAPVANLDETGWRQTGRRVWLWTVVTAMLTIFHIDSSRSATVAQARLGAAWAGVVGSDRGTMYTWVYRARRQVCWAHRKRDFQKLVNWRPGARPIGQPLLLIAAEVFAHWHRFRRGEVGPGHPPAGIGAAAGGHAARAGGGGRRTGCQGGGGVRRVAEAVAGTVDVCRGGGRGANEQRGGAGAASGRALAQGELRYAQPCGQPVRRTHAHGRCNPSAAGAPAARRAGSRHRGCPLPYPAPIAAPCSGGVG